MAPFTAEESEERDEALAEVVDPNYMFSRDADGEVDETHVEEVQHDSTDGIVDLVGGGDDHAFGGS